MTLLARIRVLAGAALVRAGARLLAGARLPMRPQDVELEEDDEVGLVPLPPGHPVVTLGETARAVRVTASEPGMLEPNAELREPPLAGSAEERAARWRR